MATRDDDKGDSVHIQFVLGADRQSNHSPECLDTVEMIVHDLGLAKRALNFFKAEGFKSIWLRRTTRTDIEYTHEHDDGCLGEHS